MLSQLMTACEDDDEVAVSELLVKNLNLLESIPNGDTLFSKNFSYKIYQILIEKAKEQGSLNELIFQKDSNGYNALENAAGSGRFYLLKLFLENTSFKALLHFGPRKLLSFIRNRSFFYPKKWKEINDVCIFLRNKFYVVDLEHSPYFLTPQEIYNLAFSEKIYSSIDKLEQNNPLFDNDASLPSPKELAIRTAITRLYILLKNPQMCIQYLKKLDELLFFYYINHDLDIPMVHPNTYSFRLIDGAPYPIPNEHYDFNSKKHSVLPNVLLQLFQKHGLGEHAVKWFGFIPEDLANKMISDGYLITESRDTSTGLLHSKFSHALQEAILILAIEDGVISLEYEEEGEIKKISLKDILAKLIEKNPYSTEPYWKRVVDSRSYELINFCDPNWLAALIMRFGNELHTQILSDYLIDNACKGLHNLEKKYRQLFEIPTVEDFLQHIDDSDSAIFASTHSIQRTVKKYEVMQKKRKIQNEGNNYLVTELDYHALTPLKELKTSVTQKTVRVDDAPSRYASMTLSR